MKQLNVRIDEVTRSQVDYIKGVRGVGEQLLIKQLFDEEFKRLKVADQNQTKLFEQSRDWDKYVTDFNQWNESKNAVI